MIDIGGRRLNLDCLGTGSPTVFLESGLGAPMTYWSTVMHGIEPLTRVCAYDRAGYGYSDAGPEPRTTDAIVDDFQKMLGAAREAGPFVLVGHSFGGYTIRVFTARYPDRVKGLIFVDSSHPQQMQRLPGSALRRQNAVNKLAQTAPFLSGIGVTRAALWWANTAPENVYLQSQPKFASAMLSELNNLKESGRETSAASPSFGDLPLTVLTAGKDGTGVPELYKLWRTELQPELVQLSARGSQTVVEGSTHNIPTENPGAVIEAVRQMLGIIQHP